MNCPLVFVEWEDSAQPVPGWNFLDALGEPSAIRCASVGWLVHDGEAVKSVAPNMGWTGDHANVQVSGTIQIPTRCILKLTRLSEPDMTSP